MSYGISFLENLTTTSREELLAHCELTTMRAGPVDHYNQQGITNYIHFPIKAVCSLDAVLKNEHVVTLVVFGSDMFAGNTGLSPPIEKAGLRSSVVIPGQALKINTAVFNELRAEYADIELQVLRTAMAFLHGVAHEAACSLRHSARQRVAERIIKICSLTQEDNFAATSALVGSWAGCCRSTAQSVVASLKADGAIDLDEGFIQVKSEKLLERAACGCSRAFEEREFRQLALPIPPANNVVAFRR